MSLLPLTLSIGFCLIFTFVVFFLREQARRSFSRVECETLLPPADATPRSGSAGECDFRNAPFAD